jgi:4-amino-4-deoxy-L-arabinose transferase-like glycosyltransferase
MSVAGRGSGANGPSSSRLSRRGGARPDTGPSSPEDVLFGGGVRVPALLPGILTLLLLLPGITRPFWDRDEAEYAAIARDMASTGHFLNPQLFGRAYEEKPPLTCVLSALSFRWLGESELAGRLPHVLLFSGSAVILFLLGRRLFDSRRALFAAMMLPTCLLGIVCGRLLLTDSALLFFSLASVLGVFRVLSERRPLRSVLLGGAALGLGILSKGPIALLPPALFAAGYFLGGARFDRVARRGLLLTGAVALFVSAPWFLFETLKTQGEFLRAFLLKENVQRFLHPRERHGGPPFYYVAVLLLGFFPWSGLFPGLLRKRFVAKDPVVWGLWAWGGGLLLLLTLSATKLPSYLLPALPAFALLISKSAVSAETQLRRFSRWLVAIAGATLFLAVSIAVSRLAVGGSFVKVVPSVALVMLPFLALPLLPARRLPESIFVLSLVSSTALSLTLPPALDAARCWARLGREAKVRRRTGEPVGAVRIKEPALRYYSGEGTAEVWISRDDVVRATVNSPDGSVIAALTAPDALSLARDRRVKVQVLESGLNAIEDGPRELIQLCRASAREPSRPPAKEVSGATESARIAEASELRAAQAKRVSDDGNGARAHRRSDDHRREQDPEERIEFRRLGPVGVRCHDGSLAVVPMPPVLCWSSG